MQQHPGLSRVRVQGLTVVYDDGCALCRRAHVWLKRRRAALPLRFLACTSQEAQRRFGALPWLGDQLMVVADDGRVWAGPPAFVMCLWALRDYRWVSRQLAHPRAWPLAARLFALLSSERDRLSAALSPHNPCADGCCSQPIEKPRGPYR